MCSCLFRYIRNEMTNCIMLLFLDSEGEDMLLLLSGRKRKRDSLLNYKTCHSERGLKNREK